MPSPIRTESVALALLLLGGCGTANVEPANNRQQEPAAAPLQAETVFDGETQQNDGPIHVKLGDTLLIKQRSVSDGDMYWQYANVSDPRRVRLIDQADVDERVPGSRDDEVGTSYANSQFRFQATAPGEVHIRLFYTRPGDFPAPGKRDGVNWQDFDVRIDGAAKAPSAAAPLPGKDSFYEGYPDSSPIHMPVGGTLRIQQRSNPGAAMVWQFASVSDPARLGFAGQRQIVMHDKGKRQFDAGDDYANAQFRFVARAPGEARIRLFITRGGKMPRPAERDASNWAEYVVRVDPADPATANRETGYAEFGDVDSAGRSRPGRRDALFQRLARMPGERGRYASGRALQRA